MSNKPTPQETWLDNAKEAIDENARLMNNGIPFDSEKMPQETWEALKVKHNPLCTLLEGHLYFREYETNVITKIGGLQKRKCGATTKPSTTS